MSLQNYSDIMYSDIIDKVQKHDKGTSQLIFRYQPNYILRNAYQVSNIINNRYIIYFE